MLDEDEFLGAHGIRAISRYHLEHPCVFDWGGQEYRVHYLPAESDTGMFGGQLQLARAGVVPDEPRDPARRCSSCTATTATELKVECPTGSGNEMNLLEVADEIGTRLATDLHRDEDGRRPVFGGIEKFQTDPHWHDLLLFHEYFHGDNGAGIGASHQTGWTGTVALLFTLRGALHGQVDTAAALAELTCACRPARPSMRSTRRSGCSGSAASAAGRCR